MSPLSTNRSRFFAACAFGGAILAACIAGTVQDKFSGTQLSDQWDADATSEDVLSVSGGKLNFSSDDYFAAAFIRSDQSVLSAVKPWTVVFDYALNQGTPPSEGAWSGLIVPATGAVFGVNGIPASYPLILYRTTEGTFLGTIDMMNDTGIFMPTPLASIPASGTFVMAYNAKKDRLQVYVNNASKFTARRFMTNFNPADEPSDIFVEFVTTINSMPPANVSNLQDVEPWLFTNGVQVDNYKASGKGVVAIPVVD